MKSRISGGEWTLIYAAAGIIDVLQWLSDLTGIGAAFNEVADPFIGIAIAGYFQLRGVSIITDLKRLGSLIGAVGLEEISLSIAPAWIADVWYIHGTVKEETAKQKAREAAQFAQNQPGMEGNPANRNGRREPTAVVTRESDGYSDASRNGNLRPLVVNGRRAARPNNIIDIDFKPRGGKDSVQEAA